MAPEYAMRGYYSLKSDVFSFGVLILEILTGRSSGSFNIDESVDLLSLVWHYTSQILHNHHAAKMLQLSEFDAGVGALDHGNNCGDHRFTP